MDGKKKLGLDVDWGDGRTLYIKAVLQDGSVEAYNRGCPSDKVVRAGDRIIAINKQFDDPQAMLKECRKIGKAQLLVRTRERKPEEEKPAKTSRKERPRSRSRDRDRDKERGRSKSSASGGKRKRSRSQEPQKEAAKVLEPPPAPFEPAEFNLWLDTGRQQLLGIEVDWINKKNLYIRAVQNGAITDWNRDCPTAKVVSPGDRIISVNGFGDDSEAMANLLRDLVTSQARFQMRVRGPPLPPAGPAAKEEEDDDDDRDRRREKDEKREKKKKAR